MTFYHRPNKNKDVRTPTCLLCIYSERSEKAKNPTCHSPIDKNPWWRDEGAGWA